MSDIAVVREMAGAWQEWQAEPSFPFNPDHCINGTRVAVRTLERLGIKAKPVSVQFLLFNRFAWDLFNDSVPADQWPPHAWSLGVAPNMVEPEPNRWFGHLMAEGADFTLDLSAAQFHRPGRIEATGPLVTRRLPDEGSLELEDELGQVLLIKRWPENNGWRVAPGWVRLHEAEVTELYLRTIGRMS